MTKKEAIIQLIKQDLKHQQIIQGIERMGFGAKDFHHFPIFEAIFRFIPLENEDYIDRFSDTYMAIMKEAATLPVDAPYSALDPLAEQCYTVLQSFEQLEQLKQDKL